MAFFRIQKTQDYTVMSNHHLKNKDLSLKAKGLLSMMLSLPDDWNFSINGLCSICKENETAIKTALKELKSCGYLTVTKLTPDKTGTGRIEWVYDVFETPQHGGFEPEEIQEEEKQYIENLPIENHGQLNTNNINTKKSNTDESNTDCMLGKNADILKSRIFDFFESQKLKGDPETFWNYYSSFMTEQDLSRRYKILASKWSDREYVDMPEEMYDADFFESVMKKLPEGLSATIKYEIDDSECMQIRYGTYKQLKYYLDILKKSS